MEKIILLKFESIMLLRLFSWDYHAFIVIVINGAAKAKSSSILVYTNTNYTAVIVLFAKLKIVTSIFAFTKSEIKILYYLVVT